MSDDFAMSSKAGDVTSTPLKGSATGLIIGLIILCDVPVQFSTFRNRPGIRIQQCDLTLAEDFRLFLGKMETVVCLNVVEHAPDDGPALRNIASSPKAGGRAIILVPQDQSVYGTLDKVLGHYRRYSEDDLRAKMGRAGLRVERLLHFNRVNKPAWYINGRLLKKRTFGRFQLWVFDRMVALANPGWAFALGIGFPYRNWSEGAVASADTDHAQLL